MLSGPNSRDQLLLDLQVAALDHSQEIVYLDMRTPYFSSVLLCHQSSMLKWRYLLKDKLWICPPLQIPVIQVKQN